MEKRTERRRVLGPAIAILLALNLGWLARLEVEAQQASKLMEHHLSLEQGVDSLTGLQGFARQVGNHWIEIDSSGVSVVANKGQGSRQVTIYAHESGSFSASTQDMGFSNIVVDQDMVRLQLEDDYFDITKDGKVRMRVNNEEHSVVLDDEGVLLTANEGKSNEAYVRLSAPPDAPLKLVVAGRTLLQMEKDSFSVTQGTAPPYWSFDLSDESGFIVDWNEGAATVAIDPYEKGAVKIATKADISLKAGGNISLEAPDGEIKIDGKKVDLNP